MWRGGSQSQTHSWPGHFNHTLGLIRGAVFAKVASSGCPLSPPALYLPSLNSMSFQVAPLHFLSRGEWIVVLSKKQGFSNKLKEKEWGLSKELRMDFIGQHTELWQHLYGFASKDPCLLGGHQSAWRHSLVGSCSKNSSVGKIEQTLTSNPDRSSVTLAHCLYLSLSLPQGSFSLPVGWDSLWGGQLSPANSDLLFGLPILLLDFWSSLNILQAQITNIMGSVSFIFLDSWFHLGI